MKLSITFLRKLLIVGMLLAACALQAWHFVIDIPRTLIDVDAGSFFKDEIGASGILYTLTFNNPAKLKDKTFGVLNELGVQNGPTDQLARDPEGTVLPQVYCDFLLGKEHACKHARSKVRSLTSADNSMENGLIENITEAIFSPAKLAKHAKIVKDGHKLVQDFQRIHGQGSVYIMSNLNKPALEELYNAKHTNPAMRHFSGDRIFISEKMKVLLPHPTCFEVLARNAAQKGINLDQCVFISSMQWNVQAARQAGLKAVWVENKDFKKARKELQALGVAL